MPKLWSAALFCTSRIIASIKDGVAYSILCLGVYTVHCTVHTPKHVQNWGWEDMGPAIFKIFLDIQYYVRQCCLGAWALCRIGVGRILAPRVESTPPICNGRLHHNSLKGINLFYLTLFEQDILPLVDLETQVLLQFDRLCFFVRKSKLRVQLDRLGLGSLNCGSPILMQMQTNANRPRLAQCSALIYVQKYKYKHANIITKNAYANTSDANANRPRLAPSSAGQRLCNQGWRLQMIWWDGQEAKMRQNLLMTRTDQVAWGWWSWWW